MKKILIIGLLLTGLAVSAAAQDIDKFFANDKVRQELALTDKEVQDLEKIWEDTQKQIELARADREVRSSELKRLLLEEKVNMAAVEKSLREASDMEFKVRLAQIERAVRAKGILGEKRWAEVQKFIRGRMQRARDMMRDGRGPGPDGQDRPKRPNQRRNNLPPRN